MSLSKNALQRKREKKKKKRQVKVSNIASPIKINYCNWQVYECWVPINLCETGIGQIIISRRNYHGEIAVGIYLIDVFCLGIKGCFVSLVYLNDYENTLDRMRESCGELELVEPSYAKTLIYKSAEYAKQLGFNPHNEFAKAKNLLKNIPIDENLKFTFGRDEKPFYMQGPHESPAEVRKILKTLESNQRA